MTLGKSILQQIQETVIQYARAISHVIKVDVEIVDNRLTRIAGTGVYQNQVNENMSAKGFVYQQVLASGKTQLIEDPGFNELCQCCPQQACCDEKLEICTPIKLGQDIIGVIGLICFTHEQKKHVQGNLEAFQQFLLQIAEFISAKAYVHQETERSQARMTLLNQVINSVDKGVIILDDSSRIVQMNSSAGKQLRLLPDDVNQTISIEATGDWIMGAEEFKVNVGNKTFKLMGKLLSVAPGLEAYDKIFIFNELKSLKSDIVGLTNVAKTVTLQNIIGNSECIKQIKSKIRKIANSNSTVFITGESGTGKELIAGAIYAESNRRSKPFIAINCGAIPDTLLESELFGYVKGAFTGADPRGKIGKFELANKGVIFLDEVGDMPLYLQVKLLRVLQDHKLVRIGSNQLIELDVRVIAATNKNLKELIQEKKFREDLYYRLNVIPLEVPPLRERREDIPAIASAIMEKYSRLFDKRIAAIDEQAMDILMRYPWPGNVREMENTIEFMINMADEGGALTVDLLPKNLPEFFGSAEPSAAGPAIRPLYDVEQEYIMQAIKHYGDTTKGKQEAARRLGIGIATLYRKLQKNYQNNN